MNADFTIFKAGVHEAHLYKADVAHTSPGNGDFTISRGGKVMAACAVVGGASLQQLAGLHCGGGGKSTKSGAPLPLPGGWPLGTNLGRRIKKSLYTIKGFLITPPKEK